MKKILLAITILCTQFSLFGAELIFNTQDFKPFSYQEKGKNLGAGVEIVEHVCQKAGITFKINFYPWTRAQKGVEEGDAQGLFILAKTPDRDK